MIKMPEELCR